MKNQNEKRVKDLECDELCFVGVAKKDLREKVKERMLEKGCVSCFYR